MGGEPLLKAVGICKTYWKGAIETPVLGGIDLTVVAGSRVVITGPSGSGKSTFLHILGSLDPPTRGQVFLNGEDLYRQRDRELSRLRNREIGFVFQFQHLLPEMTALENVMVPLLIREIPGREAEDQALRALEEVDLLQHKAQRPAELSGGEQQRVSVARAVVGKPTLLLADEPTGNLDRENGERVMSLLMELCSRRGMTLILVTHNEAFAARFSERWALTGGRLTRSV